jgi:hypothetical protein
MTIVKFPARRHVEPTKPSDVTNLAERARAIVAAKNLELPELKHRYWGDGERGLLLRCILAMRPDLNESSAHTCARDIEEGRSTFEAVANGKPVDANRLVALQEAWKAAQAAYETAVEEECKRSGQNRMSVGHSIASARSRAAAERRHTERQKELSERFRLLEEAIQAKGAQWLDEVEGRPVS